MERLERPHSTGQFTSFFINRIYRDLQRCVRTKNVSGYNDVLPTVLDLFFALYRPNYARYGTQFLHQLQTAGIELTNILNGGAFSIRRTHKSSSRTAVDLSLEQSYNRDAASERKGMLAIRNSESAMRRWALARSQTTRAVTELRSISGLEQNENASAQVHDYRMRKDNEHVQAISSTIEDFVDPFSFDLELQPLMNLASGKSALLNARNYLLRTLKRGKEAQEKFIKEWRNEPRRFLRPVKKTKIKNFAEESTKGILHLKLSVDGLRDVFARLLVVVGQRSTLDLPYFLSFPITIYPIALALPEGTLVKTQKSKLLHKLEDLQKDQIDEVVGVNIAHHIYDGGLLLHSVSCATTSGTNFGSIVRNILSFVCGSGSFEVYLCFDRYKTISIKQCERELRGADDRVYIIDGANQILEQADSHLLRNSIFKEELTKFLLQEWKKDFYVPFIKGKTVFASHGGTCYSYTSDLKSDTMVVQQPQQFQNSHEEADTLMTFFASQPTRSILVRASDTDVLVILIGYLEKCRPQVAAGSHIVIDYGLNKSRRLINVTAIKEKLEETRQGLAAAIPGYHAFTGYDFRSAFYR